MVAVASRARGATVAAFAERKEDMLIDFQIAWRQWDDRTTFYVANLPQGESDWGYVTDRKYALPLSVYWQRRFRADCERVNSKARFAPFVHEYNERTDNGPRE